MSMVLHTFIFTAVRRSLLSICEVCLLRHKSALHWSAVVFVHFYLFSDLPSSYNNNLLVIQFYLQICIMLLSSFVIPRLFISCTFHVSMSRDSAVGVVIGYGLDDQGVRVQDPERPKILTLHIVQTGSGAHPASYPMGMGAKVAGS
jgi:hypothetical protein